MNGDFLSVLAAIVEVVANQHPELLYEINKRKNYYRTYIFPDGSPTLDATSNAYEEIMSYNYPKEQNDKQD